MDRNAALIFSKSKFITIITNIIIPINGRNFFRFLKIFSATGYNGKIFCLFIVMEKYILI